jgi:hypothetical protein
MPGMLTKAQAEEILALQRMRDDEIDFADISLTADWSNATVGKFCSPVNRAG